MVKDAFLSAAVGGAIALGMPQASYASDWTPWSGVTNASQLEFRTKAVDTPADGYGTPHTVQFRNRGPQPIQCEVRVRYSFRKGVPLGPCTYTVLLSIAAHGESEPNSVGSSAIVDSVTLLRDGISASTLETAADPANVARDKRRTVAEDAAARQAARDQLLQQTADDAKRISDANAKLAEQDAKHRAAYKARQQSLDNLANQILQAKGVSQPFSPYSTTTTGTPPVFGFSSPTFGGGNVPILPTSKSLFGQFNLAMRQFDPKATELAPYFDVAKALAANNSFEANLLEKAQTGSSVVSAVSSLFHRRKDPSKDDAAKAAETKKDLEAIQKNYDLAKSQADPQIDGLVDKVLAEDFQGINAVLGPLAPADRTKLINREATNGDTPLHAAAMVGNLTLVRYLHDSGATVDAADPEGRTPLIRAAETHQADAALLLLSYGADQKVRPLPKKAGVNPPTASETAKASRDQRLTAVLDGRIQMIQAADDTSGVVAFAASGDAPQLSQALQDRNPDMRDAFGWTPLHCAAATNQLDVIKVLADSGADLNACTLTGRTPLTLAVEKDQPFALLALIRNGADPALKDANGDDPLSLARALDRQALVMLLTNNKG